jgi:hypothetical protein
MTTFAQHSAAFEAFLDCVQGGAGKDAAKAREQGREHTS